MRADDCLLEPSQGRRHIRCASQRLRMNLPQLRPTSVITSANLFTSKSVFILSAWSLTAFHYQLFIYYEPRPHFRTLSGCVTRKILPNGWWCLTVSGVYFCCHVLRFLDGFWICILSLSLSHCKASARISFAFHATVFQQTLWIYGVTFIAHMHRRRLWGVEVSAQCHIKLNVIFFVFAIMNG